MYLKSARPQELLEYRTASSPLLSRAERAISRIVEEVEQSDPAQQ